MKLKEILKALQEEVQLQKFLPLYNTWRTCDVGATLLEITVCLRDGVDLDYEIDSIRVKPVPKILIGEGYYKVPEPIRLEPRNGIEVWSGNATLGGASSYTYNVYHPSHRHLFHSGMLYYSKEQALLALPMEKAFYNERIRLLDSYRD